MKKGDTSGVPPQDIDASITDPLVGRISGLKDEDFLMVGPISRFSRQRKNPDSR